VGTCFVLKNYWRKLENAVSPTVSAEGHQRYSHSRHPSRTDASKVALVLSPHLDDTATDLGVEPSSSDKLKNVIEECGMSLQSLQDLLRELPSQESSERLIDYYFDWMFVFKKIHFHGISNLQIVEIGPATLSLNAISAQLIRLSVRI
jgi:hypothetical protein